MTKKQKKEWAINKAVSVLTQNNPIDIFKLGCLKELLEQRDDLGLIIASEYSPEASMKWQEILGE